ncbi:preprotein translocase subunit SecA [Propionicimonas sp.]|uniref:preprotein translocase subunit SecA n=1 Tax=Propionicimonas sp. TaxID=1955623 RepID=UPI00180CD71B|nr:preprotein translocase subunit SecA [Propionicimonas sp.]MBU3977563.1 preprotein translocase subunit SecA [Actinomycetota bacterium]MBA3021488.1 preprotein translocase subunit SecA [Propionicimonas sp.]MBU3987037.1 preprotein translocase subunit SecA [Actinomycetota bacterium]MBU4008858.1 preprotein translocase subunit SecA [Actinomycetota bacterium]MBU4065992.1 preprotein translocase subunit SecA [Actinomycetota bacterium]
MDKVLHFGEGRQLKKLKVVADHVNQIEPDFEAMSDDELRGQTEEFRRRLADGEELDSLMPEAFAAVREASKRVLGKRHFDVQLQGAAALHWGNIAEMKTGEGKTLVAVLASYLNALPGKGVHVVTVNDYLAKFQSEQMGRIHHFLGLKVGAILSDMTPAQRRDAYACDITYGTNNEFGFDYLRDNMALSVDDCVQRGHHYAVVDEVDSILVDEARTPLIISGPAEDNTVWYPEFAKIVKSLSRDVHYEVDEKKRTVAILETGISAVEDRLGIENLYESANTPLISYLNNAIKAKELFKRDKDYVLMEGEVLIVDEHTGRTLIGRRYNEGLHQALEAKEEVEIKDEYQTLATITLQNYFRMYNKLAGMTGTAKTEESEFQKIYGLGVLPIETNQPMIRKDQGDLIYRTEAAKFDAIVTDVAERYAKGQPMLLGTASVAKSELLSKLLKKAGVAHEVLNAKNHAREAAIVALAGRKGAVTVATNMAGRGTDIILGGNSEFLADQVLQNKGLDPVDTPDEYEAAWADTLAEIEQQVADEHVEVVDLGGLYVIGSERHESRRIDNQLRGRSGRQGDPGESRFYLSLEDDLMRLFKSDVIAWVLQTLKIPDDVPIENSRVTKSVQQAQEQVESQNFEMRKNVLKYDDVMNRQRHAIYGDRRRVLEGADVEEQLRGTVSTVVEQYVRGLTADSFVEDWDFDGIWTQLRTLYPVKLKTADYADRPDLSVEELVADFQADAQAAYDDRTAQLGEELMREFERQVLLTVLDRKWREHLYEMDYLREGIGLRAMAQRDPLVEYQREGGDMFNTMMEAFMEEVVGYLFNLEVRTEPAAPEVGLVSGADGAAVTAESLLATGPDAAGGTDAHNVEPIVEPGLTRRPSLKAKGLERTKPSTPLAYTAPDETGAVTRKGTTATDDPYAGVGRNAQCPCGSGKKFKVCHGRNA